MKSTPKSPADTKITCASHPSANANIRTDIQETIQKLQYLSNIYMKQGKNDVRGMLTDLWKALGVDNSNEPSRYSYFLLPNGTKILISIRLSNHNANCKNYVGKTKCDENFIFVIQKQKRGNSFRQHPMVEAKEFVFVEQMARDKCVDNFASKIVESIISVLQTGNFHDYTGIAIAHESHAIMTMTEIPQFSTPSYSTMGSPHFTTTITKESKTNKNMKNTITESQLRQIISESIKKVLKETEDSKEIIATVTQ